MNNDFLTPKTNLNPQWELVPSFIDKDGNQQFAIVLYENNEPGWNDPNTISALEVVDTIVLPNYTDDKSEHQAWDNLLKDIEVHTSKGKQVIVTSRHAFLLQMTDNIRVDHFYIYQNGKVTNIIDTTNRELRPAQNLMKMYVAGAFLQTDEKAHLKDSESDHADA